MKNAIALNFGMSGLGKEGKCQWPSRAIGMFDSMPWRPRGRGWTIHYTSSLLGTSTESVRSTSKSSRRRGSIQSNVPYEFLLVQLSISEVPPFMCIFKQDGWLW